MRKRILLLVIDAATVGICHIAGPPPNRGLGS
jgi:hypothetical protein